MRGGKQRQRTDKTNRHAKPGECELFHVPFAFLNLGANHGAGSTTLTLAPQLHIEAGPPSLAAESRPVRRQATDPRHEHQCGRDQPEPNGTRQPIPRSILARIFGKDRQTQLRYRPGQPLRHCRTLQTKVPIGPVTPGVNPGPAGSPATDFPGNGACKLPRTNAGRNIFPRPHRFNPRRCVAASGAKRCDAVHQCFQIARLPADFVGDLLQFLRLGFGICPVGALFLHQPFDAVARLLQRLLFDVRLCLPIRRCILAGSQVFSIARGSWEDRPE